jgi:hypothetical protein
VLAQVTRQPEARGQASLSPKATNSASHSARGGAGQLPGSIEHHDLRLGLADASVAVIAAKARTTRILTLDERHFRSVRPLWGKTFDLLPADAR